MVHLEKEHQGLIMEAGYIYLGMRKYKEARELFEGLCVLAPDSELPYVALGNTEFCQGKIAKAIRHYEKALKVDPNSHFAKVYLGEALFFSKKKDDALKLLKSVADADRGGAGEFARALLVAIKSGFAPPEKDNKKGGKGNS